MIVNAYSYGTTAAPVLLGDVATAIWSDGFKFSEARHLQVSTPINAAAPNIFDRNNRIIDFGFAAGRSFSTVGAALAFMTSHAALVPAIADLQFTQGGQIAWLRYCGIQKVELVKKAGAMVVFSYAITGGTWSLTRN